MDKQKMNKLWRALMLAEYCNRSGKKTQEVMSDLGKQLKQKNTLDKDRRKFMKTMGAGMAVGSAALALPIGVSHAAPPNKNPNLKVAIIGAGLAGLGCADALIFKGVYPDIFEGRDRVGGRCSTVRPGGVDLNTLFPNTSSMPENDADHLLRSPGWTDGTHNFNFTQNTSNFQVAEAGGELIDTTHTTMRNLIKQFKLETEDLTRQPGDFQLVFGGGIPNLNGNDWTANDEDDVSGGGHDFTLFSEEDFVDAFRAIVPIWKRDFLNSSPPLAPLYEQLEKSAYNETDLRIDGMNLRDYLDETLREGIANGSVSSEQASIIYSAYQEVWCDEFGDEIDNQTPYNLLGYAALNRTSKFKPFGVFSDERFHILNGNDQIPLNLARRIQTNTGNAIHLNHKLMEVDTNNDGKIKLTFEGGYSPPYEYDIVIFCIPFSVLRFIEGIGDNPGSNLGDDNGLINNQLDPSKVYPRAPLNMTDNLGLSPQKRRAIHNLDYGHNTKLYMGFNGPVWKTIGNDGGLYIDRDSDLENTADYAINLQSTWETSPSRATAQDAILLDYGSGDRGLMLGVNDQSKSAFNALMLDKDNVAAQAVDYQEEAQRLLNNLDKVYTKIQEERGVPPMDIDTQLATNNIKVDPNNGKYVIDVSDWPKDNMSNGSYTNNQVNYFLQIADFEGMLESDIMQQFGVNGNRRVFFAGEHTDSFYEWQGFMEGGINSGIKAADDVLLALKKDELFK